MQINYYLLLFKLINSFRWLVIFFSKDQRWRTHVVGWRAPVAALPPPPNTQHSITQRTQRSATWCPEVWTQIQMTSYNLFLWLTQRWPVWGGVFSVTLFSRTASSVLAGWLRSMGLNPRCLQTGWLCFSLFTARLLSQLAELSSLIRQQRLPSGGSAVHYNVLTPCSSSALTPPPQFRRTNAENCLFLNTLERCSIFYLLFCEDLLALNINSAEWRA